jgi:hypothetical protein
VRSRGEEQRQEKEQVGTEGRQGIGEEQMEDKEYVKTVEEKE